MRTVFNAAFAVFLLDQASKHLVLHVLNLAERGGIDVLPPLLNLRMAWNRGINFGLFSGNADATRWMLIAAAMAIVAWVAWWMRSETRPLARVSAGLMIGGAIGNVIDRVVHGAVVDFINMSCCGIANPWSFNVADISIFAGAIGLIFFATDANRKAPRPD